MVSCLAVGTAITAIPPFLTRHHALAIVTKSPHGCNASPNLPKPPCSNELYDTIISNFSDKSPERYRWLSSQGKYVVVFYHKNVSNGNKCVYTLMIVCSIYYTRY